MICENGRVVAVEDGWIWVETIQTSSCTACSAKSGCGQSLLNSIFAGKRHYVKVSTKGFHAPVQLHDEVELAIPEDVMLKGSFWVYLLPLLLLISGALLGEHFQLTENMDVSAAIGALIGFLAGLMALRLHAFRHRHNPAFHPVLSRVIHCATPVTQPVTIQP